MIRIICRVLISVFLFLFYLELLLRLGGLLFLGFQEYKNHQRVAFGYQYKIMCIGDSATAGVSGDSYPSQLENILNERVIGGHFKVINKGLPAASTAIIMHSVESWLEQYQPDMVISMMGTNDRSSLNNNQVVKKEIFLEYFQDLRIYKLGLGLKKEFIENIQSTFNQLKPKSKIPVVSPFKTVPDHFARLFFVAMNAQAQGQYDQAEAIYENLLGFSDLEITFQQRVATELSRCYLAQKKYQDLMLSISFNLKIWDFEVTATDMVQHLCKDHVAKKEVLGMLTDLVREKPESIPFNGFLEACYQEYGDRYMADLYRDKIYALSNQGDNPLTKENYLKLHRLLKEKHIQGVYVQYPLRDVSALKRLLGTEEDYASMIFVDNKDSFKEAKDPQKYGEYFLDHAMNDIGHGTLKGNRLLAENVALAILKYLHLELNDLKS